MTLHLDAEKLVGFYLKMDLARVQAKDIYETTFQQILADYKKGLSIVIVSEGDISTYSSFSYLLEKIKAHHFWHQEDDYTITSKGFIWTYPGKSLLTSSICVLPEKSTYKKFECYGICSDYILKYKKKFKR